MPEYGEKKKHFCIENDLKNQSFCITNPCTCDTRTNSDLQGKISRAILYYTTAVYKTICSKSCWETVIISLLVSFLGGVVCLFFCLVAFVGKHSWIGYCIDLQFFMPLNYKHIYLIECHNFLDGPFPPLEYTRKCKFQNTQISLFYLASPNIIHELHLLSESFSFSLFEDWCFVF